MRHAWLILAHDHFSQLEKLIAFLDSENADIFLHIDAKAAGVDPDDFARCARRSRVTAVERRSISWGDFSMVEAELALLRAAVPGKYDYYHLLSGVDVPVKTRAYIEDYFTRYPGRNYVNFLHPVISREDLYRVRFRYPFQKLNIRRVPVRRALRNLSIAPQLLARADRTKSYPPDMVFQKGAQWFDITHELAALVLSKEEEIRRIFRDTYCPDEMVVQTVVMNSPLRTTLPPEAFDNDYRSCCRYVDWKRGKPYTFSAADEEELLHTPEECLFARKFDDRRDGALVDRLFSHFGGDPSPVPAAAPPKKKICILGPIPMEREIGGVAVFDMGLAEGFQRLGADVFIATEQPEECSVRHYRINHRNIRSVMERERPDLILASLQYGTYFAQLKKWGPRILMLHGVFNYRDYGRLKALAAVALQRAMIRSGDYVFANSNFTRVMNGLMWNLPVDAVIPLGTTRDFLRQAQESPVIRNAANRRVVYVGRWVKSKQVDKIVRAAVLLHRKGVSFPLDLAGTGDQEAALRQLAAGDGEITFHGFVPHKEIYPFFHRAEIFVSLSEAEPFGITFAEALMAGCKIICPDTGGQTEFLRRFPDRVRMLSSTDPSSIAGAMEELMNTPVPDLSSREVCPAFDYAATAQSILDFLKP